MKKVTLIHDNCLPRESGHFSLGTQRLISILFLLVGLSLNHVTADAQITDTLHPVAMIDTHMIKPRAFCGTDAKFIRDNYVDTGWHYVFDTARNAPIPGFTPPGAFSAAAIQTCGAFSIYYEDIEGATGIGFDDPVLGATRRANFCAVLTYIQSTFDFSAIPAGAPIRIHAQTSYASAAGFEAPIGTGFLARATPTFLAAPSSITSGFLQQYVTTGIDPAPPATIYHAEVQVNFDKTYVLYDGPPPTWAAYGISYQEDHTTTFPLYGNCNNDLYSVLLHEMGHCLGWVSLVEFMATGPLAYNNLPPTAVFPDNVFTHLDASIRIGTVYPGAPTVVPLINTPFTTPVVNTSLAAYCNSNYWLTGDAAPDNYPVFSGQPTALWGDDANVNSYGSHLDDQVCVYPFRAHVSPGDRHDYVMGPFTVAGELRRDFTKGEIQSLTNIQGYTYIGGVPYVLPNHLPFSNKMASYDFLTDFIEMAETVPADFSMVNTGTPLVIDLTDAAILGPDLSDADGDIISVDTFSVVNFRGCGDGSGNNHNQLSFSAGNTRITYTPRANFYGRTQFGFNLWDGKERGSFYVITIDVTRGSAVSVVTGANLVVNPGMEEGTEVKILGTKETIRNAVLDGEFHEGKWFGSNFSDGHPYNFLTNLWGPFSAGDAVHNSKFLCSSATILKKNIGAEMTTFPGTGSGSPDLYPLATIGGGERYQPYLANRGYYYLTNNVLPCKKYVLEFDAYSNIVGGTPPIDFRVGFMDSTSSFLMPAIHYFGSGTISASTAWQHIQTSFWLCGTDSFHIMCFDKITPRSVLIDNFSLVEDINPDPLSVLIVQEDLSICDSTKLTAVPHDTACTTTYFWIGGTATGVTTQTVNVAPATTTVYTVVLSDGCRTDTAFTTVFVEPSVITGPTVVCVGDTIILADSATGGAWSSSDITVATVDLVTGVVVGVSAGTVEVTYTYCTHYVRYVLTVLPLPSSIVGLFKICQTTTTYLGNADPGGTWSGNPSGIVSINPVSGEVTGLAGGTVVITYTLPTGCRITATMTIDPLPTVPPIFSTATTICIGDTLMVGNDTLGGIWETSNAWIAGLSLPPGGGDGRVVTGVNEGVALISYTVTNECGPTTVVMTVNVIGIPNITISGILGVCSGDTTVLLGTPPGGTWASSAPSIASVDAVTGVVTGHIAGSVTITYTATNMCGTSSATTNVVVDMKPYITTNFITACQTLSGVPDSPDPVISGHGECIKVCDSSVVRYYANGVAGSAFTWNISGGTVIADYGDSIDVFWTTVGLTGSVVLHGAFHHCIDSANVCIKVIDKPDALFSSLDSAYCVNANIIFTDLSTGDPSSPIIYWHWNFGDGTATASSTSSTVEHSYSEAGTYTVTLTVRNQCNCTDSFKKVIEISKYESPLIICPSVVCDSEYATYTTKGNCRTFVWTVDGGTYMFDTSGSSPGTSTPVSLDPTGTILTESTGKVTIRWDKVDPSGFGYITLYTPGCRLCESPTTLKVPVILPNANVKGRDTICTNTQELYELPLWPATSYQWGVLDNPGIIPLCREDHKVVVSFPTAGTYTLHGTYQNQIKLCGGDVFKVITVLPPSAITGARRVCLGTAETYSLTSGHSGTWEVKDHLGNVIATSAGAATTFNYLFPATGTYKVWAYGDFCADHYTVTVIDIPSVVDSLIGPDTVCLRRPYTYRAANNVAGYVFEWQAIGGSVSPVSGLSTVTVDWTSAGTKQLRVRRVDVAEPFCPGPWLIMDVIHEIVNPNVTGDTLPCANSLRAYTSNYLRGEAYEWAIYPNTAGSVVTGLHSSDITVRWNNTYTPVSAFIVATIRKCDSTKRDTLSVVIRGATALNIISVNPNPVCGLDSVRVTATPGAGTYTWNWGNGYETITAENVGVVVYPANSLWVNKVYTVQVTANFGGVECPVMGIDTVEIEVLPGPTGLVSPSHLGIPWYCRPDSVDLRAIISHNAGSLSYTWHGGVADYDSTIRIGNDGTYYCSVVAANGCRLNTYPKYYEFDNCVGGDGEEGTPCNINYTMVDNCGTVTLTAIDPITGMNATGGWAELAMPGVFPGSPLGANPATVSYPYASVHTFYFYGSTSTCSGPLYVDGLVPFVPNFKYRIGCRSDGIDTIFLTDNSSYSAGYAPTLSTWFILSTVGTPAIPDGLNTYVLVPAGSSYTIEHTVTYSPPGGGPDVACSKIRTITLPTPVSTSFSVTTSPICERLPINFTPSTTGSVVSYYWDFGDGASLLLHDGIREYTWVNPFNPNFWNVQLTVKDAVGCEASAAATVEIHRNLLAGTLGEDTTICSADAPYTLFYTPEGITPITPISYLWSTGATTPTIDVNESGSFWVEVTGLYQCSAVMPVDSAVAVRIIQTPPAIIRGPRHYCAGDEINLNGYAGEGILYQWLVDGVATTAPVTDPVARWIALEDTFSIQLRLRIYDSVTQEYCDVYSPIDTIRVYSLPAPPTVTGPLVVDCDAYRLTLIASSGVSGTFNWVGLPAGPVANINMGGPYKVWFTDLRGCVSTTTVYVPLDPRTYEPYFPDGCYDICKQQMPLTVYGPPCASLDYWAWGGPTGTLSAGFDEMDSLDISDDGPYQWVLDNGLCKAKIGIMDLTNLKCNACQGVALGAVLHCTPDSPSSYSIDVSFNTSYPATTYILGTDIGPITPFTGSIAGAGSYTASLKFTTMERDPLPDRVTIKLVLTTLSGLTCYEEVTIPLDTCSWIAERATNPHHTTSPVVGDREGASALLVFPNPAADMVSIQYNYGHTQTGMMLTVYDVMGRKVAQTQPDAAQGSWSLNAATWVPGMYVVRMEGNGQTLHAQRIIIVH